MKQKYDDIKPITGLHRGGICSIVITPREWLQEDPIIDFATGKVLNTVLLKEGKFWMQMQLTQKSYEFAEVQKTNKSGDYYEISASGLVNTFNYNLQQILTTLSKSDLVVMLTGKTGRKKLIGDSSFGMKLVQTYTNKNNPNEEKLQIEISCQSADPSPYYNTDNTPDIPGNFLIDTDGNFLLVE